MKKWFYGRVSEDSVNAFVPESRSYVEISADQ